MPTIIVKYELVGDTEKFDATNAEISGSIKSSLAEDYGNDAWGGYNGPMVTNVTVTVEEILPENVRESISNLLTYNWPDESKDYERLERDGEDLTGHIYSDMQTIAEWLGEDPNP